MLVTGSGTGFPRDVLGFPGGRPPVRRDALGWTPLRGFQNRIPRRLSGVCCTTLLFVAVVSVRPSTGSAGLSVGGESQTQRNQTERNLQQAQASQTAQETLERALEEVDRAEKVGNRLRKGKALCTAGVSYLVLGRNPEALDALQAALDLSRETGDTELQWSSLYHMGLAHDAMGDKGDALDRYNEALLAAEELEDVYREIKTRNNLGELLNREGRHFEARHELAAAEQKLAKLARKTQERARLQARVLVNLGISQYHMAQFPQALHRFEFAEELLRGDEDDRDLLSLTIQKANTLLNLCRLNEAIRCYRVARELADKRADRKREGDAWSGLGFAYQYEGRQEEALAALREAQAAHVESDDPLGEARDWNNLGLVYENLSRLEDAGLCYENARKVFHETRDARAEATILANLGRLRLAEKDLERAETHLSRSLELAAASKDRKGEAATAEILGRLRLEQQRYEDAKALLEKARDLAEEMHRPETLWRALAGLGDVQVRTHDAKAALQDYLKAVETIEQVRTQYVGREFRDLYLEDKLHVYNRLIQTFLELNDKYGALESLERRNLWRSRNRVQEPDVGLAGPRRTFLDGSRALSGRLFVLDHQIQSEEKRSGEGKDRGILQSLKAERAALQREQRRHDSEFERTDPLFYGHLKTKPIDVKGIRETLPADAAVLAYFLGTESLHGFCLTAEGLEMESIETEGETLSHMLAEFRRVLSRPPDGNIGSQESMRRISHTLYAMLVQPFDKAVRNKNRWYILPDDMLWTLPFAALTRVEDGEYRYLVEDHEISLLNNVDRVPEGQANRAMHAERFSRVVAFGDPRNQLPGAGRELLLAEKLSPDARIFSGALANEQNLLAQAPGADILVLAAHAVHPPASDTAYIELSPTGESQGRLTTGTIMGMDLKGVELVLLSGCGTGLSHEGSELFVSLSDAFLLAGAAHVVATLWDVSDSGTYELMGRFVRTLKEIGDPGRSLYLAQRNCLAARNMASVPSAPSTLTRGLRYVPEPKESTESPFPIDLSHPYYWAAFVLIH